METLNGLLQARNIARKYGRRQVLRDVSFTVEPGQTLAIVEAMKLMNEIESEFDGTVKEIYVENEQMVEYGQPMFLIG